MTRVPKDVTKDQKSSLLNQVDRIRDIPRLKFHLSLSWWTEEKYDKAIDILIDEGVIDKQWNILPPTK